MERGMLFTVSLLVLLLGLFTSHPTVMAQKCYTYNGTICASVISYPVCSLFTSIEGDELLISDGINNLTGAATIDPICVRAGLVYYCNQVFQQEVDGVGKYYCMDACWDFYNQCLPLFIKDNLNSSLPDCNFPSLSGCIESDFNSSLPEGFKCPEPLIINPNPDPNITNPNCLGACCVPCPQIHYMYPTGSVNAIDQAVFCIAIISMFLSLFVMISYGLMPEKRTFPSVIIICLAGSLSLAYFQVFMAVGDPNRVRCIDSITQSSPGNNQNRYCQFQSTFVIYGFLSAVFWFCLLVLNIYVSVIFLSKKMRDYRWWFQPIGWGLPWAFVIAAQVTGNTGYGFGISCVLATGWPMNAMLMIPIACILFPAVLLNLHVLMKIAFVARKRNASLQAILKIQLRSFFFVTTCLAIFLFYWIYIEVGVNPLILDPNADWLKTWFACIAANNGQTECSHIAAPHVPKLVPFAISELLVYGIGFVIFGFFFLKQDLIDFWREVLGGNTRRIFEKGNTSTFEQTTQKTSQKSQQSQGKEEMELARSGNGNGSKKGEDED